MTKKNSYVFPLILLQILFLCTMATCAGPAGREQTESEISQDGGDKDGSVEQNTKEGEASVEKEADGGREREALPEEAPPEGKEPTEQGTEGGEGEEPPIGDKAPEGSPIHVPVQAECENLNPLYCPLPWPSMRYLTPDSSRVTGFRLEYHSKAMPRTKDGKKLDPLPFQRLDGFSTNTQILTIFSEPVDVTGLASMDNIPRSLKKDSPTILIDLKTGDLVAHWVENDARAQSPKETLFYIHPAVPLKYGHAYGVALRNLKGKSGKLLRPTEAFRALRDKLPSDAPSIEGRRKEFETLFAHLTKAGLNRQDLLAAWQFRTASFEATHQTMLAMRADAIKRLGKEGIQCTAKKVEKDYKGTGATVVTGTITTPHYMTAEKLPAKISRDKKGNPVFVKNVEIPFTAVLPKPLLDKPAPAPLLTLGHGLFGDAEGTLKNKQIIGVVEKFKVVMVGTDWAGMSSNDLLFLAQALADPSLFYMVGEMLRQAMINQIALTRTFLGKCRNLPEFQKNKTALIDPARRYYIGVSQGAILGGTLLTLSPDIERGALLVGGTHFSFMIERSIHFNKFELFLSPAFPKRIDRATLMALSQHVWDRAESGNYLPFTTKGIQGNDPRSFLYIIAENDAQVPNLSSDLGARLAGIPVLSASVRKPWGIPVVKSPYKGSAYISYHYGDPDPPKGNLSPKKDHGGHWNIPLHDVVGKTIWHFFETGEVTVYCKGSCDLTKP